MSKTPKYDAAVKKILDDVKPGERVCELTGEKWVMTDEEIGWYKTFNVPPSKRAPHTRWKVLCYFTTGFQFWWNKHFETGKPVLSFHHPATGVRVLPDREWLAKDFSSTNQDYDSERSFFEQLHELQLKVPMRAEYNVIEPENSISLVSLGDKNSYFVLGCQSINCFVSALISESENTSEGFNSLTVTNSHNVVRGYRIYNCKYVRESVDCIDSAFLFDCRNCKNCFGATNKRNREYIFFNEQLSKEEYERRISEIDLGRRSVFEEYIQKFDNLMNEKTVWPQAFNFHCDDSTGEYLTKANNSKYCYVSNKNATDCYWVAWALNDVERSAFSAAVWFAAEAYECITVNNTKNTKFCYRCNDSQDLEYCMMVTNSKDCFGCIALNRKQFCIFNKQFTEDEYWKKLDEIKTNMLLRGEYGEFLPTTMSTTYPPESGTVEYCETTEEELDQIGRLKFGVHDEGATGERGDISTMKRLVDIPDSIDDLTDDWVGVPIFDDVSDRKFAFLKPEVEHYRALRIAPPNKHIVRRMFELTKAENLAGFETRACNSCNKELMVAKNTKYPERKIYCKEHYLEYIEKYG